METHEVYIKFKSLFGNSEMFTSLEKIISDGIPCDEDGFEFIEYDTRLYIINKEGNYVLHHS